MRDGVGENDTTIPHLGLYYKAPANLAQSTLLARLQNALTAMPLKCQPHHLPYCISCTYFLGVDFWVFAHAVPLFHLANYYSPIRALLSDFSFFQDLTNI